MNKVLHFFNKSIAAWVILFGLVAYFKPGVFSFFKGSINWFFALAMFGIGMVLREEDYRNIIRSPWIIAIGVVCQFSIMPLLALATSALFNLSPAWTLGLILTGAAPGAMTSNVISYLSKGDVAYSVSLTAAATLLCPVLTPLITLVLADTKVPIQFMPMFIIILLVVVVPLILGFLAGKFFPNWVRKLTEWPSTISVIAIVVITSFVIAVNKEKLGLASFALIGAVAFHNAAGMGLGFFAGYLTKLRYLRRKTLSI